MSNEDRSARYHRLKRRADVLGSLAVGAFLLLLVLSGASLTWREAASIVGMLVGQGFEEAATVAGMAVLIVVAVGAIELPFGFYSGYLLEHRYGLSNERSSTWVLDQLRAGALGVVLTIIGATVVYSAIRLSPEWWWLLASAVFGALTVGLAQIAPTVLLPLFYSFKPLERPELVARLRVLATRAGTHVRGVYEWALSTHTRKANAALAGLGNTRRILLSDTLLADYSDDEIEVVMAHELSHHVHHDLWRGLALQSVLLIAGFFLAARVLAALASPLGLRGLDDPAGLPLLMLVGGAWMMLSTPLVHAMSRAQERRADRYALDTTRRPDAFVSAMRRLSQQNLAEDNPSTLVQVLFYSHPPIRERIEFARRWPSATSAPPSARLSSHDSLDRS